MIEINEGHRRTQAWNQGAMECDLCDKQGDCIIISAPHPWSDLNICRNCWEALSALWHSHSGKREHSFVICPNCSPTREIVILGVEDDGSLRGICPSCEASVRGWWSSIDGTIISATTSEGTIQKRIGG